MPVHETLRVGLLGAAGIAPDALLIPAAARPDVEVVCVAARDPERARLFAAKHAIPEVVADYAALVERDDLDLVYIALPPHLHRKWAIAALAAGRHVLCEKPFALDAGEAREMTAAAGQDRKLIEAFHYRFHPLLRHVLELVQSRAIGRILSAEAWAEYPIPLRPDEPRWTAGLGGGALMDLGCYALHALRTLLASEPRVVTARQIEALGVDADAEAELLFPGNIPARVRASMRPSAPSTGIRLDGELGRIELRGFVLAHIGGTLTVSRHGAPPEVLTDRQTTYAAQLDHVVAVLRGDAVAVTGGTDAIANMQLIDDIRRTWHSG